jgi:hypothetical protein
MPFIPPEPPLVPQTPTIPPSLLEQKNVQLNSPLALIGAFIYIVRERFQPNNNTRYTWLDNKSATSVLIEASYEKNDEVRDARPAIYTDKGQTVYQQRAISNRDQWSPSLQTRRLEQFYMEVETDIKIDVVAATKGESVTLADIVQQHITCSQRIIETFFTLRRISPSILGRTEPFLKDQTLWNSPLEFRVNTEFRWATLPVAPVMREIFVNTTAEINEQEDFFRQVYIQSLNRP